MFFWCTVPPSVQFDIYVDWNEANIDWKTQTGNKAQCAKSQTLDLHPFIQFFSPHVEAAPSITRCSVFLLRCICATTEAQERLSFLIKKNNQNDYKHTRLCYSEQQSDPRCTWDCFAPIAPFLNGKISSTGRGVSHTLNKKISHEDCHFNRKKTSLII